MASPRVEVLEKLEELLNCSVCLGPYTNPRILQCFHVYCQGCLKGLVKRGSGGNHTLSCPECRSVIPVPANGVVGFQAAYRTVEYQDIHKALKSATFCTVHKEKELELYCDTCEELICLRCAYRGGQHQDHNHEDIEVAFKTYRDVIKPFMESRRKLVCEFLQVLDHLVPAEPGPDVHESVKYQYTTLHETRTELMSEQAKARDLLELDEASLTKKELLNVKSRMRREIGVLCVVLKSTLKKVSAPDPSLRQRSLWLEKGLFSPFMWLTSYGSNSRRPNLSPWL